METLKRCAASLNLDSTFRRNLDVRWLQVTVHDAFLVRGVESLSDLCKELDGFLERNRSPRETLGERLPFHELHDEKVCAVEFFETMDSRDARMVQSSEELGFALEPSQPLGVARKQVGKNFDGYVALELRVARAVDFPHAARSNRGDDFIFGELRLRIQGHGDGD